MAAAVAVGGMGMYALAREFGGCSELTRMIGSADVELDKATRAERMDWREASSC
jgi:hypothetical protein